MHAGQVLYLLSYAPSDCFVFLRQVYATFVWAGFKLVILLLSTS
jgi:hypothetical protein